MVTVNEKDHISENPIFFKDFLFKIEVNFTFRV